MISGGLMISDRKMSKLKGGIPLKLSILQMFLLLMAIILASISAESYGTDLDNTALVFVLFTGSLILNLIYIIGGPNLLPKSSESSEE